MDYVRDRNIPDIGDLTQRAETLIEALPWIKSATGKTVVVKYGGAAMENPDLMSNVMTDILLLKLFGINPVIVHGGGKAINAALEQLHLPVSFHNGMRVTTPECMKVVEMVLMGKVNPGLVGAINRHGNLAVGVSGVDAGTIEAVQRSAELGCVGDITEINPAYLNSLIANDYIPIIASIAVGKGGTTYNINADLAAGYVAAAIHAHKIIFLTNVDGLFESYPDPDSLIFALTMKEAREMLDSGKLSTGMIPKITSCLTALEAGIPRAHIINGTTPHALLLELLTDRGVGTTIYRAEEDIDHQLKPLDRVAARLSVNLHPMQH